MIKLAQIRASRKTVFAFTVDDTGGRVWRERSHRSHKAFQVFQQCKANFVGGRVVERQLNNAIPPFPAQGFAGERFHDLLPAAALLSSASAYMALISVAKRALMASRRNLPITVKSPFSGVRFSASTVKLRTWR